MTQFPEPMRPFIIHVKDVQADENCRFRAVEVMLDFEEDRWAQIRRDMLQEINAYVFKCLRNCGACGGDQTITDSFRRRSSICQVDGHAQYGISYSISI